MSALSEFIAEGVHHVPGALLRYGELSEAFHRWAAPKESYTYTRHRFGRELRDYFPVGRLGANVLFVGNASFAPAPPLPFAWIEFNGRLVQHKTKRRGNLTIEKLLPLVKQMRGASAEEIAAVLNKSGRRNWRGNPFTVQHVQRILETII